MLALKPHQIAGAEFMFDNAHGCLNASQPGTGKTAMAITAMCLLRPKRVLIVCPGSIMYNWEAEIGMWATHPYTVHVLDGTKAKRLKIMAAAGSDADVMVVNYEMLNNIGVELIKWQPQLIICDESHKIKGHKSISTKALKEIAKRAQTPYRWIMSGTPTPNNPLDIWSQYDFIRPGYLGPNFFAFRATYAHVYTGAGFPMIKGFKNQDQLKKLVGRYMYRVTKDECLDLPPVTYQTIKVEFSDKSKKIYRNMAEHMVAEIGNQTVNANIILVKMLRLQEMTSGFTKDSLGNVIEIGKEKLNALLELLESLGKEKVIIWCRFNHEIEMVRAAIKHAYPDRKIHILAGSVSNEDRQAVYEEFQRGSHTDDVILANVQVGGVGINLTASAYAIYFSRTFSFGDADQSESRINRLGQTRNITYYDLVVGNSIDEYILKTIQNKSKMSDHLTGDDVKKIALGII